MSDERKQPTREELIARILAAIDDAAYISLLAACRCIEYAKWFGYASAASAREDAQCIGYEDVKIP